MTTTVQRLLREDTLLLIVDVQERLLPAMFEAERVVRNCALLARAARLLNLPVVVTEQYPEKLGTTAPMVADALGTTAPVSKMLFSACTTDTMQQVRDSGRPTVLLCGLETHVCVMQTALDLIENGFIVFVPGNAVSSRYESDKIAGLERMHRVGVMPASTESAIFELLREAGTPEFKALLPYIK